MMLGDMIFVHFQPFIIDSICLLLIKVMEVLEMMLGDMTFLHFQNDLDFATIYSKEG